MSRARARWLVVDPIACDAFGYCVELLPEVAHADEWGYPVIADAPVPGELMDLAETAVRDCPRRALRLVAQPLAGPGPPGGRGPSKPNGRAGTPPRGTGPAWSPRR